MPTSYALSSNLYERSALLRFLLSEIIEGALLRTRLNRFGACDERLLRATLRRFGARDEVQSVVGWCGLYTAHDAIAPTRSSDATCSAVSRDELGSCA